MIGITGLSAVIGSWKTIPIDAPRISFMSEPSSLSRSFPSRTTLPPVAVALRGRRPRIAFSVMLLPLPDSPTRPIACPRRAVNETPSTAWNSRRWLLTLTRRSLTSRIGSAVTASVPPRDRRR
jgi:hypothetical protein